VKSYQITTEKQAAKIRKRRNEQEKIMEEK